MIDGKPVEDQERLDARRYRRLRILGAAVYGTPQLSRAMVVRFSGLDEILDEDLRTHSSRGEAHGSHCFDKGVLVCGWPEFHDSR